MIDEIKWLDDTIVLFAECEQILHELTLPDIIYSRILHNFKEVYGFNPSWFMYKEVKLIRGTSNSITFGRLAGMQKETF